MKLSEEQNKMIIEKNLIKREKEKEKDFVYKIILSLNSL